MKKSLILIFLLLPLCLFAEWNNIKNLKVAVIEMDSRVKNEDIDTRTLSEMLEMHLVNENSFQIVERALINKIVKEQEIQMSSLTESEMIKIGTLAGANKILSGSISHLNDRYYVIVKGIDTVTGIVDLSDQIYASNINDLIGLLPQLAKRIVKKAAGKKVANFTLEIETPAANNYSDQEDAQEDQSLSGLYSVNGKNPDGSSYHGTVRIQEKEGMVYFTWYIGRDVFKGKGMFQGDLLVIDWGSSSPVVYQLAAHGVLQGSWANGSASEVLTPVE